VTLVAESAKSYAQYLWITLWINLGFIAQIRKKHTPCLDWLLFNHLIKSFKINNLAYMQATINDLRALPNIRFRNRQVSVEKNIINLDPNAKQG
jgi:hypothetical protein